MKKLTLILTLWAITMVSIAHGQDLPKGEWIDLTVCQELGTQTLHV